MSRFASLLQSVRSGWSPVPPLPGAPDGLTAKGSATGKLIAVEQLGQPVWSPRDYGSFAREGFMQNAIVYRSVRMVAEAAASIPLLVYEGGREVETHPLLDLLRQPSNDTTGTDLLEAWYGFLLVAGNAYIEAVALDGRVRELHVLRPDRMKVLPGADGWPEGYEYTAAGRSVRFGDEPVPGVRPILHVRLFHPANDHYGMSPIEAAATAIDIHNTASNWNKALLDNSARPSGALVYAAANGQMTGEQFERLRSELETNFQGAAQAGRPLLLEGGLDWKPLSLTPKDMDFIEAKNAAAREIALAIGVPPMLLGIPGDNTYSNYQEATRVFWRQTVLPLVARTAKALSGWLEPAFLMAPDERARSPAGNTPRDRRPDARLELRLDLDQVEALSGEREALWRRLQGVSFLTDDEKRAAIGYGAKAEAGQGSPRPFDAADDDEKFWAEKYRPDQPRVPAGSAEGGRWTDGGGTGGRGADDDRVRVAQASGGRGSNVTRIGGQRFEATPAQTLRLSIASRAADRATERVREIDPTWRATPSMYETIEGAIRAREAEVAQAEARFIELRRDAIPNTSHRWGVNRLKKELYNRDFRLLRPAKGQGFVYRNSVTAEEVRIMSRPKRRYRTDPPQKHENEYYYRYLVRPTQQEGQHITIIDKVSEGKSDDHRERDEEQNFSLHGGSWRASLESAYQHRP